ncbi:hypothetical protein CEXT_382211 [Caerostris extrusa]|uniref:Uncharacterized protein n=1 Tax=Caerostris extrusa TaxID=172846 RepID=A0AAV4N7R7_CAEEX|nr:hypothetical protein CEXT_382211 [Caerostris extrusa]
MRELEMAAYNALATPAAIGAPPRVWDLIKLLFEAPRPEWLNREIGPKCLEACRSRERSGLCPNIDLGALFSQQTPSRKKAHAAPEDIYFPNADPRPRNRLGKREISTGYETLWLSVHARSSHLEDFLPSGPFLALFFCAIEIYEWMSFGF